MTRVTLTEPDSYLELGKYSEAADDVIKALDYHNQYAYTLLGKFKSQGKNILLAKLHIQQAKDKNNNIWSYFQGGVYEGAKEYDDAIKAYSQAYQLGASDIIKNRMAACYRELGNYNKAFGMHTTGHFDGLYRD